MFINIKSIIYKTFYFLAPLMMTMSVNSASSREFYHGNNERPSSFKHFGYYIDNGTPPDVGPIAQTANGDLWLASTSGLFLFDGLRFQRFKPSGETNIRSDLTYSMFVDSMDRVWFGYYSGGASVVIDGKVTNFENGLPKGPLKGFTEDSQGRIWAISIKGLSYFQSGFWHAIVDGWSPHDGTPYTMLAAKDGTLWVATGSALLYIRPGGHTLEHTNVPVKEAWALAQAPDGRIWLSDEAEGTRPIALSAHDQVHANRPMTKPARFVARRLLFDRMGNLWMALQRDAGIVRIAQPGAIPTGKPVNNRDVSNRYTHENGMSSDLVESLLEDRHGVIWAGTRLGIDKFTPVNFTMDSEIPNEPRTGFRVAQSSAGAIAVANDATIHLYLPEERLQKNLAMNGIVRGLCANRQGGIVAAGDDGLSMIQKGSIRPIALPKGLKDRILFGCQFDQVGKLWVLTHQDGVWTRDEHGWKVQLKQNILGAASPRMMMIDNEERLWLGLDHNGVGVLKNDTLWRFGSDQGLKIGFVLSAAAVQNGVIFGGELGIATFDGKFFHSLTNRTYPQLSLISGLAQDRSGTIWLSGSRGVVTMTTGQAHTLFDFKNDIRAANISSKNDMIFYSQLNCCENTIFNTHTGKLLFLTAQGISRFDPTQKAAAPVPPRPIVRSISSRSIDMRRSNQVILSKNYPDLDIEYTSDDIANAENIQFRYRLIGISNDGWIESGSRRQAAYTSLDAGKYSFQLQSRNPDGEWSSQTAKINFVVPPTFFQTYWAKILGLCLMIMLIAVAYRVRLKYAVAALRKRLEERTRERERIARDLHDTLLQSLQALIFKIEGAKQGLLPTSAVFNALDSSIEQAEGLLDETRRTVQGLRLWNSAVSVDDLLDYMTQELPFGQKILVNIIRVGNEGPLHVDVSDEILRVVQEAMVNILRHADADAVDIIVKSTRRSFTISISDNGVGMPPDILAKGARAGHFGLIGMRERAERMGARLDVSSEIGRGTRLTLIVPARKAFASRTAQFGSRYLAWLRKGMAAWRLP